MSRLLLISLLGLSFLWVGGQELPPATRQQLEQVAESSEAEIEDDGLLQQLEAWQKRPLNLNVADAEDLRLFPFLTELQIGNFFRYRKLLGPLVDLHELQSVPGWDLATILEIRPYVQVSATRPSFALLQHQLRGGHHQLLVRSGQVLQRAKGYRSENNSGFAGSPIQLMARYQYRHPEGMQWGITTEKDAGEPLFQKGFRSPDFFSFHFFARKLGKIKALAAGDFTANLGQGLIHWQGLAFGKGPMVLHIKRQSPVLRPYAAAGESQFLRGAGITVGQGAWEASFFAGLQRVDANTGINEHGAAVITSFNTSGLHRTAAEQEQRKAVKQQVLGGRLQYSNAGFVGGINAVYYQYGLPVEKRAEPYNLFAIRGRRFLNLSSDYGYTWRNLHLFGELAISQQGGLAWVQGLLLGIHPKVDIALQGRAIAKRYTAINAAPFSESSSLAPEQGWYSGVQVRINPAFTLSAYADIFRFPWLRYNVDAPTSGSDYLLQAVWQPDKNTHVQLRFLAGQKPVNDHIGAGGLHIPAARHRQNLRLQVGQKLGRHWLLRSRAEMVWLQMADTAAGKENGFLWYADLQYRTSGKWDGSVRFSFFETGSYDSRLYAFEPDVPNSYSIPALFGAGARAVLVLRYQLTGRVVVSGRFASSIFRHQDKIGSGLMEIAGNRRTDLRVQLQVKL